MSVSGLEKGVMDGMERKGKEMGGVLKKVVGNEMLFGLLCFACLLGGLVS